MIRCLLQENDLADAVGKISLPSHHNCPGECFTLLFIAKLKNKNIGVTSFPTKMIHFFSPEEVSLNDYHSLLGANLRWISVPSMGSQRLLSAFHHRNRLHGPLGSDSELA